MGEDEVESEGWSYVFLHTRTLRLPSRQIVGNSRQLSRLSPLFWQIVDNRRRPRRSLLKTLQSITLSLQNENHKNCPFSLSGVLYLSPLSRCPSPTLKVDVLRRARVGLAERRGRSVRSSAPSMFVSVGLVVGTSVVTPFLGLQDPSQIVMSIFLRSTVTKFKPDRINIFRAQLK